MGSTPTDGGETSASDNSELGHDKQPDKSSHSKDKISKKYFQNLKIWYTNSDTLTTAKINELSSRIQHEHPDIICITEAYPKFSHYLCNDESLQITGYDMLRTEGGRGIIIYTAHHLIVSELKTSTPFHESLWCNIKITKENNIIFGGVYRSPSSNEINNVHLSDLLKEIQQIKHDHIIIAGDFNTKQIDWDKMTVNGSTSSYQYKLYDTINDLFLTEIIKEPTRYRGTSIPSKLDWVLTENPECVTSKSVEEPLGPSDHSVITVNYNCIIGKNEEDASNSYSFYNGDYEAMRAELENPEWNDHLNELSAQGVWDKIQGKINGLIERHVPKKRYTNTKHPPWYGREIGTLSKNKKKAWNKYRKQSTPENWLNFTKHRNTLAHTIEQLKENYENKIALEVKTNPKQFWKYVRSKTKSKGKINDLEDVDGNIVTDDLQKAEILNNHFASVFTQEDTSYFPEINHSVDNLIILENINISLNVITKNLKSLNISKAPGPDGINSRILRETAVQIAPALKILFDKSMFEGKLPYQWKEAHVIALFKKGSRRSPNNYRPVSLTAICCKLLEKLIRNNVVDNLEKQGLIHLDQHGFRQGRSCCTQLLEVMEIWTRWFDLGLPWDTIYTDFSKAFDSVPHKRLLLKVKSYGIRGNLLNWIEDFLSDRKQRVVLGSQKSSWKPVTSGIPQGSVLGPILFIIFINDMPKMVESLMKLFADDSKIFKAIESFHDISVIQDDINKLIHWSIIWQLPINIGKCKCLHYGKNNPHHTYSIGNTDLINDETEKDVGVTFDSSLEFRIHIKSMISKANSRVGLIKRSFSKLSIQSFKLLYKSLVRPILEYCSSIWFPLFKTDSIEIEKVQRRATKLVPFLKNKSYTERLRVLNLTTLAYRRNRTDVLQVFRIIHQIDKIPFDNFFKLNQNNTRGHPWKLEKPRAKTKIRQNTFSNRVINDWNNLPAEVVCSETINSFKNGLEKAWRENPIKYSFE